MITALKAKKLCNKSEQYHIYQEFVFHNSMVTNFEPIADSASSARKRDVKAKTKLTLREKFTLWEEEIYQNELVLKFPDILSF